MVNKLPKFNGYIIDFKLGEFRKVNRKKMQIEFIKFNSNKGKKLLKKYCKVIKQKIKN